MPDKTPKIVAFISGKGGSGKTTVTISITKLLADIGHPSLLIDFDLSTNGASYFFKKKFKKTTKGIWETLGKGESSNQLIVEPVKIGNNFEFVPSRTVLNSKGANYDSISFDTEYLINNILSPLVDYATKHGLHYVLIDCQAGYSITSLAALKISEMSILVTEADSISSDAADNLLFQFGESLPEERRYLVNKIDVRDADTYKSMRNVFQALNRLPPLPFDFGVRNAFGARQIPIDLNNPSPLLFALFETIKYIFTEIFEDIEEFKRKNIDSLFKKYDQKLQLLLEEQTKLEKEQAEIKTTDLRWKYKIYRFALIVTVTSVFIFMLNFVVGFIFYETSFLFKKLQTLFLATVVALFVSFFIRLSKRRFEDKIDFEKKESEIGRKIYSNQKEIDHFRSLLWARSRDFLVDIEVAGEKKETK